MYAIVNNHAESRDRLRKLQRAREIIKRCVGGENGTTEIFLSGVGVVCCWGVGKVGGWVHKTARLALQATSDLSPFGVMSLSRYLNPSA